MRLIGMDISALLHLKMSILLLFNILGLVLFIDI